MVTDVLVVWLPVTPDDILAAVALRFVPYVEDGKFGQFPRKYNDVGTFLLVFAFVTPLRDTLVSTLSAWLVWLRIGPMVGF